MQWKEKMKLSSNRESGQALVLALILLALGSLLIVPGLNLSATSLKYHQSIESETIEGYSADSGVEYALCRLYNHPGGYTGTPLQESYDLNGRTVNVTAEYMGGGIYKITSKATSSSGRSTTIETFVNLSAGAFAYTLSAKTLLTAESGATINATEPFEADIHSNGDITLGSCIVEGNASAVGTITGWEGTVTGDVYPGASPVRFPGDYSELYKILAQEVGSCIGDVMLEVSGGYGTLTNPILFPGPGYEYGYIDGNLTIWTNTCVKLTSTVYVTGTLTMKPGSLLEGRENLLAEQYVEIVGSAYYSDYIPIIICKDSDVVCKAGGGGNKIINAVAYAPNGTVTIQANAELYGAVGGNIVSVGSNSIVTYAEQLHGRQDLPGGELSTIAYSYK